MKTWFGTYLGPHHAGPLEATVLVSEKGISIGVRDRDGGVITHSWKLSAVSISFDRPAQQSVLLYRSDNAKLTIDGDDAFRFLETILEEQRRPWHRRSRSKDAGRVAMIFGSIIAVTALAYFLLVPWVSGKLATTVSVQQEESFGNTIFDALSLEAQEVKAASTELNRFFSAMNVTTSYNIRITVVKDEAVNAFALPGGHIVVYTALLEKIRSYPELAALLSHEFSHVNNQHSTRSVFQRIGSQVFLGLVFGKMGSVATVLADRADQLKSLNYSRKLEKEADLDGLELLKERHIDPAGFEGLFRSLKASGGREGVPELLASHPDIDKRVAYIQSASGNATVETDKDLEAIFEKIKSIEL